MERNKMNARLIVFAGVALVAAWCAEGKFAPPKLEDYTHVCQKCGKTTHYPTSEWEPRSFIVEYRKGCATLRELGLDVALDESVLCRHCVSAEKLRLPRFATVKCRPEKTLWRKGDKVEVVRTKSQPCECWLCYQWEVVPRGNRYWVNGRYIDADGNILGDNVCIRLHPDLQDPASGHADRSMKMRILPKALGDPADWVPVEWHDRMTDFCPSAYFENVEYGEGEDASLERIFKHLEWMIKGKRHKADLFDLRLLLAYLRGQKEVQVGCIMSPIEKYKWRIDELISVRVKTDVVAAARRQIGVTVGYDPTYRIIRYPGGDVSRESGVCSDVIIRALRDARKIDLQKLVHEDMKTSFSKYPQMWGLKAPDANIDHRRVPNLQCYFKRKGYALPVSKNAADYKPGDIVTVMVGGKLPHIMIVSDRKSAAGVPLAIHNIGSGTQEEDVLFAYPLTGHYRICFPSQQKKVCR